MSNHPPNRYSRYGSSLRFTQVSNTICTIESSGVTLGLECVANCFGISKWRLTRIEDPFGNLLEVSYSPNGLTWTLIDSQRRRHQVIFESAPSINTSPAA